MKNGWHCTTCDALLGVALLNNRIQIRFSRGYQYIVGRPATTTCRRCKTVNELPVQTENGA